MEKLHLRACFWLILPFNFQIDSALTFSSRLSNYYYSSLIHLVIVSSTSGAIVSSIC